MERVPMTIYGYKVLDVELKERRNVRRPRIIADIEEARGHGDLKENAEYHAAKEEQGLNEARISDLESKLSRAETVDPEDLSGDRILLGATVQLVDIETDKEVTYILVGPDEANIDKNLISITSPIGKALIGKGAGDEAVVKAPSGKREYEVESVDFVKFEV